ncbi:MAG: hypothetical protein FRX49_00338 [Trebouxia sp. A1-2]|nr:MAG: hypothetical protein FRX49_00338 [Trebouxia sp. A1-2]
MHLAITQGSTPVCKASAGPCLRCPPSTSGRPFGSSPSNDRSHCRPGPSTEGVLQTLPAIVSAAQRSVRLEAVRGNKQEKTNKSSEQSATAPGEQNFMSQSSGYLSGIVNDLLYGAASRMERGVRSATDQGNALALHVKVMASEETILSDCTGRNDGVKVPR